MSDVPVGGTTGLDHETSAAIDEAARYLAGLAGSDQPRPIVSHLQQRFGLSAADACAAIRDARLIQARAE